MATSGSVGWDAPLPSATSNASDIASAFDASSFIDKTRDVKVDANDYSRFDAIRDSDDDAAKSTNTAAAPVAPVVNDTCRNCHAPGAKLKCSVCKKAVYCARPCQASDWTFHKRICKKPEAPKAAAPKRSPPKASTTTTSSSSSSSSSATAASRSASTTAKRGSTKEIVADEPDLPADVRGYKNGLPYFHRELSHHEKQLIGDIAPQKIEPAAVAAAATAPATSATNAGSAWNHAGTFEERVMTKIAQEKLSTLFTDVRVTRGRFAAVFESPTDFSGDASICVVRGRKRYLYDFNFTLPFRVTIDGSDTSTFNGSFALREISNDEDYEIMGSLKKKPKIAVDATELLAFINARSTGGSDGSSLRDDVLRILSDFVVEYQQL